METYEHFTVEQGQISLRSPAVVVEHPDVLIVEFDSKAKYPDLFTGCDDDGAFLHLFARTETLYVDDTDAWTVVTFPGKTDWNLLAEATRYTVRACLYRARS